MLTRPTNYKPRGADVGGFAPAKKNRPLRADFRREPGLQRGRRRAPFARSREGSAHIKMTLWRTERIHRPDILKAGWRVRCAYPPYGEGERLWMAGAHSLTCPTVRMLFCRVGKHRAPTFIFIVYILLAHQLNL